MPIAACNNRFCSPLALLAFLLLAGCSAERAEKGAGHDADLATQSSEPPVKDNDFDALAADKIDQAGTDQAGTGAFDQPSTIGPSESTGPSESEPQPMAIAAAEPMLAAPANDMEPEIAFPIETAAPRMSAERSPRIAARRIPEATAEAPIHDDPTATDSAATDSATTEMATTGPFPALPAGASHDASNGFATVAVYYATDRARDSVPLSAYAITGNRDALVLLSGSAIAFLAFAALNFWRKHSQVGLAFSVFGTAASAGATIVLFSGAANIEKHGVTYNADRGSLVTGIANVTVPDTHQRGVVERPSLLRFEIREDQREHIVLTSAIELSDDDFKRRLSETVAFSPDQDLLVFIHGYNVDFESAIQRTAQIAVDLPFEGVPVCYSWPSQGKLFGYTVDETNAAWTQTHLKQFLLDLARQSGAESINVVAHSMGNRPTTGAMVELGWQLQQTPLQQAPPSAGEEAPPKKLFDRVVLAAPDVDADRFRNDLAPLLTRVADHVTLYASSDDQALVASKQVHGYPRAGESGDSIVVVPGIETVDVSGVDLSLLGHSYYGDAPSMLQDLYQLVRNRLPAKQRRRLEPRSHGELTYWQLIAQPTQRQRLSAETRSVR